MAEILYHAKVWEMSRHEAMLLAQLIGMESARSSPGGREWTVGDRVDAMWGTWLEPEEHLKVWCRREGGGMWVDIMDSDLPERFSQKSPT